MIRHLFCSPKPEERKRVNNLKKAAAILTICFFAGHFLAIRPPVADVDKSGAVDLGDAIIAVQALQGLSQSEPAEAPGARADLGLYLLNAVEAFKVLAGVKSLSPQKPAKTISSGSAFVALLPTLSVDHVLLMTLAPQGINPIYRSIEPEPSTPPPRA